MLSFFHPFSTTGSMTMAFRGDTMQTERTGEVSPMKGMVPRDKMSKKARKALAKEKRNVWSMNPVTRVRESGKTYDRKSMGRIMIED